MEMKTVSDLQDVMYELPDVGVAMTIQQDIRHAVEKKGLTSQTTLDAESLEKIRQSIYDTRDAGREDVDPTMLFLSAMLSQTSPGANSSGNTVEDSLVYIEKLIREKTNPQ